MSNEHSSFFTLFLDTMCVTCRCCWCFFFIFRKWYVSYWYGNIAAMRWVGICKFSNLIGFCHLFFTRFFFIWKFITWNSFYHNIVNIFSFNVRIYSHGDEFNILSCFSFLFFLIISRFKKFIIVENLIFFSPKFYLLKTNYLWEEFKGEILLIPKRMVWFIRKKIYLKWKKKTLLYYMHRSFLNPGGTKVER